MANKRIKGITIEYDTFGERSGKALILIQGLVTQMIGWPDQFCRMLADAGHFVVRFDNRDSGLSTKMEQFGNPDIQNIIQDVMSGRGIQPPYTLEDMAEDTIGLMDALEIKSACICGVSMGGMIGQIMGLKYPQRLTGLISMQSSTGEMDLPESTPPAMEAMMSTPPMDRNGFIEHLVWIFRVFAGGSAAFDEHLQRDICARSFDRSFYSMGFPRQMAALVTAPGRRDVLSNMGLPTLVMHGDCDPVVPLEHGRDTAAAIPGARLLIVKGLGHGLAFPELWEEMVGAIAEFSHGAEN